MSTTSTINTIRVRPGLSPGHHGYGCDSCGRELDKLEGVGTYEHDDHPYGPTSFVSRHNHFICRGCIAAGPDAIRDNYAAHATERRQEAAKARRMAAALRTDPTLTDEADAQDKRAVRLHAAADAAVVEAAADWDLPTVDDVVAYEAVPW